MSVSSNPEKHAINTNIIEWNALLMLASCTHLRSILSVCNCRVQLVILKNSPDPPDGLEQRKNDPLRG